MFADVKRCIALLPFARLQVAQHVSFVFRCTAMRPAIGRFDCGLSNLDQATDVLLVHMINNQRNFMFCGTMV